MKTWAEVRGLQVLQELEQKYGSDVAITMVEFGETMLSVYGKRRETKTVQPREKPRHLSLVSSESTTMQGGAPRDTRSLR